MAASEMNVALKDNINEERTPEGESKVNDAAKAVNDQSSSLEGYHGAGNNAMASKSEPMEDGEGTDNLKPKPPKVKVMSCSICTTAVTAENTRLGSSNQSNEFERIMRVTCKLLGVDSHPMLKKYGFQHLEEPTKLCCDDCCEVVFNLGSLQSIIERTSLAINKKLEWIRKTISDSAAEESDEIEKEFFSPKSYAFRSEVLQVLQHKNDIGESDNEVGDEMLQKGVQTDISGESGISNGAAKTDLQNSNVADCTFDDVNIDTYSDNNGYMSNRTNSDHDENSTKGADVAKNSKLSPNIKSQSNPSIAKRESSIDKRASSNLQESDDDIEVLEERKTRKRKANVTPGKATKMDSKKLPKSEQGSASGGRRPKRSTAGKNPNYKVLDNVDEDANPTTYKRRSSPSISDSLSKNKRVIHRKDMSLATIPIVKDASGKMYFEGVEIVRTDSNISCKSRGCRYVVNGSGYNAFELIKAHVHDNHIR